MAVLKVLFANGQILAVQPYTWDGDTSHDPVPWDGSVSISAGSFTIGTVDQGLAGVSSWKVIDDNSAAILASSSQIDSNTDSLTTAQGSDGSDIVGPLVQGLVNDSPSSFSPETIQPLSLTTEGRLRVSSVDSNLDKIWQNTFDTPWGSLLKTTADSDIPFAGEIDYV